MIKKIFIVILIIFSGFLFSMKVFANGNLYLETASKVYVGDSFKVRVFLDTNKEYINSINLSLKFDNQKLDFIGFEDNSTVIKTWIERPRVNFNTINMTGIIPGGINGLYDINKNTLSPLPVVDLVFKSKEVGNTSFVFAVVNIFKNDGLGGLLPVSFSDYDLNISPNDSNKVIIPNEYLINESLQDKNPPLSFEIIYLKKDSFLNNENIILFDTNDLESGIKEYKIKKGGEWISIESPYIVNTSILNKSIYIRAYDLSDNYTESSIEIPGYLNYKNILIIVLSFVFAGFLLKKLLKF